MPNFTKLSTKHPRVIGIQVYLKKGSRIFQKGDNYELAKIKKNSSPEPLGQF